MTLTAISYDVAAQRRAAIAVLIMRLTLGIFLLLWSVGKLLAPGATVRIAAHFYGIALPEAAPLLMGLAELALSLALLAGFARRLSCMPRRRSPVGVNFSIRSASRGPAMICSLPASQYSERSSRFICCAALIPIRSMSGFAFDVSSSSIL